jgi:hypothetical protein
MATRMKMSVGCTAFHRVAADNDMPASDVGTNETNLQGLGGSGDWQIDADNNVTVSTKHQVVDTTEAVASSGSEACGNFLFWTSCVLARSRCRFRKHFGYYKIR